jgi:hypothetical protein
MQDAGWLFQLRSIPGHAFSLKGVWFDGGFEVRGRFALPFLKNVGFFPTEFFRHLSFCFCLVAEIRLWLCVPRWAQLGLFIAPLWVSMGWYLDRGRCNRLDFYGRAPVVI